MVSGIFKIACFAFFSGFLFGSIDAQQESKKTATIPVLVTDKKGKPSKKPIASEMLKPSFNGKEVRISEIGKTNPPRDVFFVVDISLSDQRSIDEIKATLVSLIQELREGDRFKIVGFDSTIGKATPLTSNRIILENHVRNLEFGLRTGSSFRNALFETLSGDELERKRMKAFVLLTSGIDTGSKVSEIQVRTALQETNSVLYVIQYFEPGVRNSGSNVPGQRPSTRGFGTGVRRSIKYFQSITALTGGTYVFNRSNYRRIIGAMMAETAMFRLIEVDHGVDSGMLEIAFSTSDKKLKLRYRTEYLQPK